MPLRLIKLTTAYRDECAQMIDEWRRDQTLHQTNHSPWVIFKNDCRDFDRYVRELDCLEPDPEHVPYSTFFLLDTERDRLLGAVNIRHRLNERIAKTGGHLGMGIRPSERRKGYATAMIDLALKKCAELGIRDVLMTCDRENVASAKSIVRNGGVLENEIIDDEGTIIQRYWIANKYV